VQVDGVPTLSCITLAHTVDGREITTIEGLREHPLVNAFVRADALQCGFCTPAQNRLRRGARGGEPDPTHEQIRHAMAGNLCRCGTYPEDRGGNPHVARLIRTEKEVEGRFEEGLARRRGGSARPVGGRPGDVVGRPRPRQDGLQRATGKALYTADLQLPGCCTRPSAARRTHARA
jgi:hypothetical protein